MKKLIQCSFVLMVALFFSNAAFGVTDPPIGATVTLEGTSTVYCTTADCTGATSAPDGTFYHDRRPLAVCTPGTPPTCSFSATTTLSMIGKPVKTSYIFDIGDELNAKILAIGQGGGLYTAMYQNGYFYTVNSNSPLRAQDINTLRMKVRDAYMNRGLPPMPNSVWGYANGAYSIANINTYPGKPINGQMFADLEDAIYALH